MMDIIEQCYKKSVELLVNNSTKYGVTASCESKCAKERNYLSIFARDSSICALGMAATGLEELIIPARASIDILAKYQAKNGQIPNSVKPENRSANFWSQGCIDATLWWLVAARRLSGPANKHKQTILSAINWLECQAHQQDGLVMQNEASDWADIMPRSGRVLYSNALWFHVKESFELDGVKDLKQNFNLQFYPFDKKIDFAKRRYSRRTIQLMLKKISARGYYVSFVNYMFWGNDVDIFGNTLAVIFGLASKKFSAEIIDILTSKKNKLELPMPALFNPIKKSDDLWRSYMSNHKQNYPHQYHNGGIWPFVACFFVMALYKSGKKHAAWDELEKIAYANSVNNWQFNEWFHARTGKAMGMPGQSWNAGAFLLAYHYIKGDVKQF